MSDCLAKLQEFQQDPSEKLFVLTIGGFIPLERPGIEDFNMQVCPEFAKQAARAGIKVFVLSMDTSFNHGAIPELDHTLSTQNLLVYKWKCSSKYMSVEYISAIVDYLKNKSNKFILATFTSAFPGFVLGKNIQFESLKSNATIPNPLASLWDKCDMFDDKQVKIISGYFPEYPCCFLLESDIKRIRSEHVGTEQHTPLDLILEHVAYIYNEEKYKYPDLLKQPDGYVQLYLQALLEMEQRISAILPKLNKMYPDFSFERHYFSSINKITLEKLGIMLTSAPAAAILSQLSGVTTGESLISAPPPLPAATQIEAPSTLGTVNKTMLFTKVVDKTKIDSNYDMCMKLLSVLQSNRKTTSFTIRCVYHDKYEFESRREKLTAMLNSFQSLTSAEKEQRLEAYRHYYLPLTAQQHETLWRTIGECQQLKDIYLSSNDFHDLTDDQFQIIIDTLRKLPQFSTIVVEGGTFTESQFKILNAFILEQPDKRHLNISYLGSVQPPVIIKNKYLSHKT